MKERAKWVNRKSKIGRFIEHKRKAKYEEKKKILSRPIGHICDHFVENVQFMSTGSLMSEEQFSKSSQYMLPF